MSMPACAPPVPALYDEDFPGPYEHRVRVMAHWNTARVAAYLDEMSRAGWQCMSASPVQTSQAAVGPEFLFIHYRKRKA